MATSAYGGPKNAAFGVASKQPRLRCHWRASSSWFRSRSLPRFGGAPCFYQAAVARWPGADYGRKLLRGDEPTMIDTFGRSHSTTW